MRFHRFEAYRPYEVTPRKLSALARLQRAAESPRKSARGRRHEVVEGGGVRFVNIGVDTVVLGDLGVHTKKDRGRHMRQVGATQRPLDAFNFNA